VFEMAKALSYVFVFLLGWLFNLLYTIYDFGNFLGDLFSFVGL
jgi:hypothetical protein